MLAALVAALSLGGCAEAAKPKRGALPPIGHVAVLVLENQGAEVTFAPGSPAPYLSTVLPRRGALLREYYGTAHASLANYTGLISGQGPTKAQQLDCRTFTEMTPGTLGAAGQASGDGCVFPAAVPTLAGQLEARGLPWRGYFQDMGRACRHPQIGAVDTTQSARPGDTYATRHNPFAYFHSIIDDRALCRRSVVDLDALTADLRSARTTPAFSLIVPGLCDDGHDTPCLDGRPGGLATADAFLREWVPRILGSPAFRRDGMLVVTFDEADGEAPRSSAACCLRPASPNVEMAGVDGPGGGRVGAVVLSPFARRGVTSTVPYDHYALLRTVEDLFGLKRLGYAAARSARTFGADVFAARRRQGREP